MAAEPRELEWGFRRASEAEVDARRRISLGRVGHAEHKRYEILENDLGEILLLPLVSVPAREMLVWQDSQVREALFQGMKEAAAGDLVDRGSFAQFADEPGDE